jgi:cell division septum initiation protein DivIVA
VPKTLEELESSLRKRKREIKELEARVSALEGRRESQRPATIQAPRPKTPTKQAERPMFAEPAELEKPNPRGRKG